MKRGLVALGMQIADTPKRLTQPPYCFVTSIVSIFIMRLGSGIPGHLAAHRIAKGALMPGSIFTNRKSDEKSDFLDFEKAKTARGQLIQALQMGLNFEGARRFSGLSRDDVAEKCREDVTLMTDMLTAIAEGDVSILYRLRQDTHWQAWGIILEYRKYQERKRIARSKARSQNANDQSFADDPLMKQVEEVFSLIEPGGEADAIDHLRDYITKLHEATHAESESQSGQAAQVRQLPGPQDDANAQSHNNAQGG
jgi:hypothetical protein